MQETRYVLSNLPLRTFPNYLLTGATGGCSFGAKRPQHGLPRCLPRFPMAREREREAEETGHKKHPKKNDIRSRTTKKMIVRVLSSHPLYKKELTVVLALPGRDALFEAAAFLNPPITIFDVTSDARFIAAETAGVACDDPSD